MNEAIAILRKAYDQGINFFDTARAYTDSEEKIGRALSGVRHDIVIATKTQARKAETLEKHLETSLKTLKTDYLDIYQLHNIDKIPERDDPESLYAALLKVQKKGMIRFIGISNHRRQVALEAINSSMFDTLQFPLSLLSTDEELKLAGECQAHDVGLIAMKALSGGLITNIPAAVAFLDQYDNIVPIWGIQRQSELDQFVELERHPPRLDEEMLKEIEKDRAELGSDFCRGCGYCLPCQAEIPINMAARMSLLLLRSPYQRFLEDDWKALMMRIEDCTDCGHCKENCPYNLDTPELLKKNLEFYKGFYDEKMAMTK
jgi:aryl-alcohol dehydrogenase-like predicted oxidoreductase